jgi:putative peptidoglycan lipid II flippase
VEIRAGARFAVMAVVVLACLVRPVLRDPAGFAPNPGTAADHSAWRRHFWYALLPMSLGANSGHINLLVDNAFASYLPAGEITLLGFAFVIISNTELLTTLSLAEVAFPRLAAAALRGPEALRETLQWSLRHSILVTTPLGIGALVFGRPLVRLLFERGEFGPDSTLGVTRLLACYSLEIIFMGYLVMFSRVLFAKKRLAIVAWTSAATIFSNAVLDYVLMRWLGVNGIALATTLVTLIHVLILAPLVRREVPAIRWQGDTLFLGKALASAAVMGGLVLAWSHVFERSFDVSLEAARLVEVLVGLALGGISYVGLLHLLRIEEARSILRRLVQSVAALAP